MKKILIICLAAAFFTFQSSSPWEGAAAVAPAGELPEDGYYVATNSFPRNTVVDITNIESGKSTRAIVSNGINSPGLLAIVSRSAAELIGMKEGSISRIRMVQPADPIAYMRFTETMAAGNPEYDSGNVITEENITEEALLAKVYEDDTYVAVEPVVDTVEAPASASAGLGYIVDEPEWGGNGRLQIVDLPGYEVIPFEPSLGSNGSLAQIPPFEPEFDIEKDEPEAVKIVPVKEEPVIVASKDIKREFVKDVPQRINERAPNEIVKDVPVFLPERSIEDIQKDTGVFTVERPRDEVIKDVSPWIEYIEPPVQIVEKLGPLNDDPVFEREPVRVTEQPRPVQTYVPVETEASPPPSVYGIDPNDIIPGIVRATPERPSAAQPAASVQTPSVVTPSSNFSVQTISRLDRGQYYVQVAALSADHVENALTQIDRNYKPVVYMNGDNMFRILIGPLNQGESAAILARFKSIGYRDAFVRRGS